MFGEPRHSSRFAVESCSGNTSRVTWGRLPILIITQKRDWIGLGR